MNIFFCEFIFFLKQCHLFGVNGSRKYAIYLSLFFLSTLHTFHSIHHSISKLKKKQKKTGGPVTGTRKV